MCVIRSVKRCIRYGEIVLVLRMKLFLSLCIRDRGVGKQTFPNACPMFTLSSLCNRSAGDNSEMVDQFSSASASSWLVMDPLGVSTTDTSSVSLSQVRIGSDILLVCERSVHLVCAQCVCVFRVT